MRAPSWLGILSLGMLLGGCAVAPIVTIPEALLELSAHKPQDLLAAAASEQSPDERRQAEESKWLNQQLVAVYRQLPANIALQQVVGGRPLLFDFEFDAAPKVSSPEGIATIKEHLRSICRQANWVYSLVDGVVIIKDIETRTFQLASQPGASNAVLNLRNLDSASSGDSGGPVNNLKVDFDPFQREIGPLLKAVLGVDQGLSESAVDLVPPPFNAALGPALSVVGSQLLGRSGWDKDPRTGYALLPSANAVFVTARPLKMREVERALGQYIQTSAQVVLVSITFFEVDLSKTEERSLNLNVMRRGAQLFGLSLGASEAPAAGGNVSVSFANGRVAGSRAVLNWLRTAGDTRITFEDSVEIRNNAVASLDATRTRQYVSSISRETQLAGNTTLQAPQVEFEQLRIGWSIHVQPTVVNDLITLRLHLSRSDYVNEIPFSFDEGRIAGTNFVTEEYHRAMAVSLVDGETRLLTALVSKSSHQTNSRTPWLPLLGDKHSGTGRERQTVMMLTAVLQ